MRDPPPPREMFGTQGPKNTQPQEEGGGGGTRPRYLIVCLWRRLLASCHCSF